MASSTLESVRPPRMMVYGVEVLASARTVSSPIPVLAPVMKTMCGDDMVVRGLGFKFGMFVLCKRGDRK